MVINVYIYICISYILIYKYGYYIDFFKESVFMVIMICTAWSLNENPSRYCQQLAPKAKQETAPRWALPAPFLPPGLGELLSQQRWCFPAGDTRPWEIQSREAAWPLALPEPTFCSCLRVSKAGCRIVFKAHLSSTGLEPKQRLQLCSLALVGVLPQQSLWHKPAWRVWATLTSWFPSGKFQVLTSSVDLVSSSPKQCAQHLISQVATKVQGRKAGWCVTRGWAENTSSLVVSGSSDTS